jgi:hypothetical protein
LCRCLLLAEGGSGDGGGSKQDDEEDDDASDLVAKDKHLDLGGLVGSSLQEQQSEAISALKEELKQLDEVFEVRPPPG